MAWNRVRSANAVSGLGYKHTPASHVSSWTFTALVTIINMQMH